ncbi:hypothetical protein RRF57_012887 [Xylaria bambusicola]|uniref:Uncharacterized protein n=1 Tax=Xylaria bambusicola TaxID=326684 RepID=A0AAN7Z4W3_9PEZI
MNLGTPIFLGLVTLLVVLLERATVEGTARAAREAVKFAPVSRGGSSEDGENDDELHFVYGFGEVGYDGWWFRDINPR